MFLCEPKGPSIVAPATLIVETPSDNRAARDAGSGPVFPPWTWAIVVSALAWLVIFISIPPARQNFPLGDDWAFAHAPSGSRIGLGIQYSRWAKHAGDRAMGLVLAVSAHMMELEHVALPGFGHHH